MVVRTRRRQGPRKRPLLLYLFRLIERKTLNRPSNKANVPRKVMVVAFFLVVLTLAAIASRPLFLARLPRVRPVIAEDRMTPATKYMRFVRRASYVVVDSGDCLNRNVDASAALDAAVKIARLSALSTVNQCARYCAWSGRGSTMI